MNKIFAIALYTLYENIRNKIFYVLILFAAVMLAFSILFGALGGDQETRIITNLGLGVIEALGILVAVFASVTLVLEEMESKTIYMVLVRPISRHEYVLGRYLGMLAAVGLSVAAMSLAHAAILLLKGAGFSAAYFASILLILLKIAVLSAMALFWSLFSTSAISSVAFTIFFWIAGHLGEEMRFLAGRISNPLLKILMKFTYYLIPNLHYFNLKDRLDQGIGPAAFWFWALGYGLLYIAVCLYLSTALFKKKEF